MRIRILSSHIPAQLLVIGLILVCTASGQTAATVTGVVSDSTGAIVPGVSLKLTNLNQNRSWETRSNDLGVYVLQQIPPGNYKLEAESEGFKKYERPSLTLNVAQTAEIEIILEIGAVSETVEVTAETPLLETASSTLGEVVNSITTENLPLNGRNVLQLVALTPGITTNSTYRNQTSGSGSIPSNGFSANGGRNVSSSIMLDGSPQEVMGYNQPAYVPSPDAIQEFKVQTNSLSAEYGRTGGAVVNMVHRSGTSQFHGVLYEFLRNDKFDANGFFNNLNGREKAAFRYNQFGATAGGPLTPSRETTFFFVNYEGVRQVNPSASTLTVPTDKMQQGDFSEVKNTIYDPATIQSNGERTPFAGNLIPGAQQSALGKNLLSYYPKATKPGVINNYFTQAGSKSERDVVSVKIDRRISERQNIFGRFSYDQTLSTQADTFGTAAAPTPGYSGGNNRSATLDDTYMLGAWILHGNYGYAYHANPRWAREEYSPMPSELGFPSYVDAAAQYPLFPTINVTGYQRMGPESSYIIGNKFETHTWSGDASRLIGAHTIKFGGVYRLNRVSNSRPNNPSGTYTFNDGWTRKVFNKSGGGDGVASMLLGLPASGQIRSEPLLALQVKYAAAYVQDDWRVNNRLTLNLGLRWDMDFPQTERFDRASWFDTEAQIPLEAPPLGPFYGGVVFAGSRTPGASRGIKDLDTNNFGPRIGLAYKLTDRLVLRSGVGFFYAPTTGFGPNATNAGALGFNAITAYTSSIDGGRTPYTNISDPFPDGFNQPENGQNGLLTFVGQGINGNMRFDRVPYSVQWNFNVQYEVANNMLFDVAYAGNSGVKLQANSQWNQLPDEYLELGNQLSQTVNNPFYGVLPATSTIGKATTTYGQLIRPFPWLTGMTQAWGAQAHSSYHALQTKFRKRYGNGLQFLVAYTWSKSIDDVSSVAGFLGDQNPGYTNNNKKFLDRSVSAIHVPHVLAFNFQWELPFGQGKRMLNEVGWKNHVVGGWVVNGIASIQSGTPISIASRTNTTASQGGGQRPDSTGISSATDGSTTDRIYGWFNPAAFVDVPQYTFGNVGRFLPDNFGPPLHTWDFSILKDFRITERIKLQFRTELFNALNQVNFANPATTFGNANFGSITGAERARIIQFGLKLYY